MCRTGPRPQQLVIARQIRVRQVHDEHVAAGAGRRAEQERPVAGQPQLAEREVTGAVVIEPLAGAVADVAEDVEDAEGLAVLERARLGVEPGLGNDVIGVWGVGDGLHAVRASKQPRDASRRRL